MASLLVLATGCFNAEMQFGDLESSSADSQATPSPAAPSLTLTYPPGSWVFTRGTPITALAPTVSGGTLGAFAISPRFRQDWPWTLLPASSAGLPRPWPRRRRIR